MVEGSSFLKKTNKKKKKKAVNFHGDMIEAEGCSRKKGVENRKRDRKIRQEEYRIRNGNAYIAALCV